MTKVVPFAAGEGGGIPIAALNPDTDGDGKVRSILEPPQHEGMCTTCPHLQPRGHILHSIMHTS